MRRSRYPIRRQQFKNVARRETPRLLPFVESMNGFQSRRSVLSRTVVVGAIVVLASAAVYLKRTLDDPLARLHPPFRSIDARISALDYAPYRVTRGDVTRFDLTVDVVIAELAKRLESGRNARALHRLAVAKLAAGKVDEASALLGEALSLDPHDASIVSDLAAADLAAGQIFDAVERSARAVQLDPTYAPAAFNSALALDRLSNTDAAIAAWERYQQLDRESAWAAEAGRRLAELRRPRREWQDDQEVLRHAKDPALIRQIVERYPQRVRVWVQSELLPGWIARPEPAALALLRAIASIRASLGDPFLFDIVEHATRSREETRIAFDTYKAGNQHLKNREIDDAAASFADAARQFERAGSPMSLVAEISASTNTFYAGRGADALVRLDALDARLAANGDRYPTLRAESRWIRGLVRWQRGEWNDALHLYQDGLEAARCAHETEHEIAISGLIAAVLDRVAAPEDAEKFRVDLLRRIIGATSDRRYVVFAETTWIALRTKRPWLALSLVETQQQIANERNDPLLLAETASKRALTLRDLGRIADAAAAIEAARKQLPAIKNEGMRDRTRATVEFISGTIDAGTRPDRAIASLSAAMQIWDAHGWRFHSVAGRAERGRAFLKKGDLRNAEVDFRAGIEQMEQERKALDEPPLRVAYFENADAIFESLIELLLDQHRAADALSIAERKRSRALLDQIAASDSGRMSATPMSAEAIAAKVDASATVVEYAMLDRGVAIWAIGANGVSAAMSMANRNAIEAAVQHHLAAIASNDIPAIRREGRWLFDQLITPVAQNLDPASPIVFVAEGVLQMVPFAALVTPEGKYMIEQRAVAIAPSATILLSRDKARTPTSILAVAQPAPSGWEYLPNAIQEALDSAGFYPHGRALIGGEITPAEFLAAARRVDVLCFSGHTEVHVAQASRSALIFEAGPDQDALTLSAAAIAANDLPTHPLVVLGACSTGRGKMRRNEGVDSLADAFLYAGARSVVATLWDVDDSASAELFRSMHRNLRAGATSADALRRAQLSMLHGGIAANRSPSAWASTVVIGSL